MFNRIIAWSVNNKLFVVLLTIALIVWGVFSLQQLPIDAVPDITDNQVQILTTSPSTGAEDLEKFVTFPIEQSMATIPNVEQIRSFSRFGLSVVTVVFSEKSDICWARQQVGERLLEAKTQIPPHLGEPSLAPLSSGLGEIYQYILVPKKGYDKKFDAKELRTIQDWMIRRQLLGLKGVADISSFGGQLKQYEIRINPIELKRMGVSLNELFQAVTQNNQNGGGAYIEKENTTTFIRTQGLLKSKEDIESIKIKENENGVPILVRHIAKVEIGYALRYGALTNGDKGEAVGGIVLMLKGSNSSEVIANVKSKIEEIQKSLPKGVSIEPYLDRTKLVNNAISTVTTNLIEGALIVIFVLVLLLGNLRAGLIVASVIPLAMLFAISLMNIFGVSGNLMSLGAIDFGLIVDGSVIIVEATLHIIHHRGTKRYAQGEMNELVIFSASKFSKSAVFGQLVILVVYLPLLTLIGVEGKMFKPMAETVLFAILGAFILSLTYIPMVSSLVLKKDFKSKINLSDKLILWLSKKFVPTLQATIRHQRVVLITLASVFAISVFIFMNLGSEFIPTLDEGDFAVETRLPPGSSLTKMIETTGKASKILQENFPEVKKVIGKIGSAEIPTDPMPMEAADLMVILKDKKDWTSAETKEALAEKMQSKLESYFAGVEFGFQQPIQMRFNELMTGAKQDVVVKVYGEDLQKLSDYGKRIGKIANSIQGVQDLYVEEITGLTELIVSFNHQKLAFYNVTIEEVNDMINTSFAGKNVGLIFEGEKRFDLVIKNEFSSRNSIEDLKSLMITNSNGNQVPLEILADVDYRIGPSQIQRDDTKRRIIVGFNIRGRDVGSIIEELKSKIDKQIAFEPGYQTSFGGTFKNLESARARLMIAVPVALLLIFVLLYVAFKSIKQASLVFTAIPLASIGGVIALWSRDMPFSISAGVGFIALFGVAVLNGIVLIAEFNLIKNSGEKNLLKVVMKGTRARLRPVLLTALVASLGFLPMAISHGSGAEVQKPLATVVIGGLVSATFLTLFILPILYLLSNQKRLARLKKPAFVLAFLLVSNAFFSQEMRVEDCINLAFEKNKSIAANKLESEKQQLLAKGNLLVPKTEFGFMMGQYNSVNRTDNNFSVTQSLPFPTIFGLEREMGALKSKSSEINDQLFKARLALQIRLKYQDLVFVKKQLILVESQDSLLTKIAEKMKIRSEVEEISPMDYLLFQNQQLELAQKVIRQRELFTTMQLEMQGLLGDTILVEPRLDDARVALFESQMKFSQHLLTKTYELNQQEISLRQKMNRNYAFPDISLGYFNQTLIGTQQVDGNEVYFDGSKRFQGVQIGLNVAIFNASTKHKNQALEIQKKQNSYEFEQYQLQLENEYLRHYKNFQAIQKRFSVYENELKKNNHLLKEKTLLAFQNGEISQIEWIYTQQLILNSSIEATAIENELSQEIIYLNWLKNQN